MVTVILTIRLELPSAESLKDKRRLLKPLMTRLRKDFNISIAEVDSNDRHREALIGAAVISNNGSFGHQVISRVVNRIESNPAVVVADYQVESY